MTNTPVSPPLDSFGQFRTPAGPWNGDDVCRDGPCVAVADGPDGWVAVADTKHPGGPFLTFTADEWAAFRQALVNDTL